MDLNYLRSTLNPAPPTSANTEAFSRNGYSSALMPATVRDPYAAKSMPMNTNQGTPYVSQFPGIQSIPVSFESAQAKSSKTGAFSNVHITANYGMMKWRHGYENFMLEGSPTFCMRQMDPRSAQAGIYPVLDLRGMNELMTVKCVHARGVIDRWISDAPDRSLHGTTFLVDGYTFTYKDLFVLIKAPTHMWMGMKEFKKLLQLKGNDAGSIPYLCPEWVQSMWNHIGYQLYQNDSTTPPHRLISVTVGGVTESAQNVWGNDLLPGSKLFFAWMALMDHSGRYLNTIIKPLSGYEDPSEFELMYKSFNGFSSRGILVRAGLWSFFNDDTNPPSEFIAAQQVGHVLTQDTSVLNQIKVKVGRLVLPRFVGNPR
jgi:hypothetical protein